MRELMQLKNVAVGQWFLHLGRKMQMVSKPSKTRDGYVAVDMLGIRVTLFYPADTRVVVEERE